MTHAEVVAWMAGIRNVTPDELMRQLGSLLDEWEREANNNLTEE